MAATIVFIARRIVTLNPSIPCATHVAVRDGRILGVGGPEVRDAFGPASVDDRFAARVLLPGFVEGHGHAGAGQIWARPYVGFFDRTDPDGQVWCGIKSIPELVGRLKELQAKLPDADAPLLAWGFDPIYFGGPRLGRADLDSVSATRPVIVGHISGHIINVNTPVLDAAGFSRDSNLDGLLRDAGGDLTGELLGPAVMNRAARVVPTWRDLRAYDVPGLRAFASMARRVGVTTSTDLVNPLTPDGEAALRAATGADDYPLRLVPALSQREYATEAGVARLQALRGTSTDKLRFGLVKLVLDGSIQGFSARLRWPGYHNGAPNGLFYIAPDELEGILGAYHRGGAVIHVHTNGDEASELAIETFERVLAAHPRPDHRHTLQHGQMIDAPLFRRMRVLGMCANLFANHVYYWGDQHAAVTMGPSRAQRLDACGTALREGVPLAIHSDAPVTPLAPLFTAQCAAARRTPSGALLGADERISVADAIRAITLGPAYTLKLDNLVGSIDVGKFADFAVLETDPHEVAAEELADIPVHGTILGGRATA
ncbi:MAG TPA: amidohydrolase [Acetobacteraceae bacterium]|nr:amidohydrolase [Acetobacteraceae bacterium]